MKISSVAEIKLRRLNERGGRYFMSLNMDLQIHSYQWKFPTIIKTVIDCVEEMDSLEKVPEIIDV